MAANAPFAKGKNATVSLVLNDKKQVTNVKSWEASPNVTEINDGVNGEDRDRLDVEVNFYEIKLTCYLQDYDLIVALLANTANNDSGAAPQNNGVSLTLKPANGKKVAFVGSGDCTVGAWKLSSAGRVDRNMIDVPLRIQYFKKAQGI